MLKKLLTISGIIPATFLAYLSIIGFVLVIPDLFGKWDWFKFLFCLSCILGLAGYFGLWVSLLESPKNNKRKLILTLIIAGLLSVSFFIFYKKELALNLSTKTEDFGILLTFFWPILISIILMISILSKKNNT